MAYFRCTTGGSGKGNTLVVTCADELAGATITCTNGTKTYTKTCPSTSPYEVTFYGLEAGTWTLSATVSGNTYTATVVITDCAALLGGFNWRTWVDTARFLDSTDYDSLAEVLADELALRELALEHACVDYMAEIATASADVETIINTDLFAKWVNNSDYALDNMIANAAIKDAMDDADKYGYGEWVITDDTTTPPTWGAKGNVPVMTSNTAPYGTVIYSSLNTQYGVSYGAFDNNPSTQFHSNNSGSTPQYLGYKFANPVCVKRFMWQHINESGGRTPKTFTIEASNTGNSDDWITLGTFSNSDTTANTKHYLDLENDNYYLYYRMYQTEHVESDPSNYLVIQALQFYGRELSVSVPAMTSNTAPFGVASESSEMSGYPAWKAFDGTTSEAILNSTSGGWLSYMFNNPIYLKMVTVVHDNNNVRTPNAGAEIQVTKDGTTWSSAIYTFTNKLYPMQIANVDEEGCVGVRIANLSSSSQTSLTRVQFYGLDYSEKEFEEGTTKKWLYDHGLELDGIALEPLAFHGSGGTDSNEGYPLIPTINNTSSAYSASVDKSGNNYTFGQIYVDKAYDLTNYSYLMLRVNTARVYCQGLAYQGIALRLSTTKVAGYTVEANVDIAVQGGVTSADVSTGHVIKSLDISAFNQSEYMFLYLKSTANIEFSELWLE